MIIDPFEAGQVRVASIAASKTKLSEVKHPEYGEQFERWVKWRLTYKGGDDFIDTYLKQLNKRVSTEDFATRKAVTYVPAFAKSAVKEIKDSIFQRIADVTRGSGPDSYQKATLGESRGVDLKGSTMNSFVGRNILPDLLSIGKIGVFVDMPIIEGKTLASKGQSRPYIYAYKAEDILNWEENETENGTEFQSLLLRDYINAYDDATGLPVDKVEVFRLMWVDQEKVYAQFFDVDSQPITRSNEPGQDIIELNLPTIPFVIFDIYESLLTDVANYQIALLNMASSDVSYSLRSNFPFYVEQYDPKTEGSFQRPRAAGNEVKDDNVTVVRPGEAADALVAKTKEIKVGVASGRKVPKGLEYPEFIHPSSEPLKASMEKQAELKMDIRQLVKLAVTNLAPKMASAESKGHDDRSLEAGLSAIGMVLENGERSIARYWTMYEDLKGSQPTVSYPQRYKLASDKDKREEANELRESLKTVPSKTYKKEAMKQVASIDLGTRVSLDTLNTIHAEIDAAEFVYSDPKEVSGDIEVGLLDLKAAAKVKGYPDDSVEKAKKDHADRAARIAESQSQARGVADMAGLANASKDEKQEPTLKGTVADETRGGAK